MHPILKKRAELHKKIHQEKKNDPAFKKMSPRERFTHVAGHVTKRLASGK